MGALLLAGAGVVTAARGEARWPAWRGIQQDGVAHGANPPVEWSEEQNVRWKIALPGRGTSTPIVWGDRIFILAAIPVGTAAESSSSSAASGRGAGGLGGMVDSSRQGQQFTVLAYALADGRELWRRVVREQAPHAGHHRDHGYASASPVTDGEMLIAHFGSYGTYGLDLEGNVKWEVDLGDMQTRNSFGEGSSPALDGDTVVILWDHEEDDFIVALDRRTGKERWRQSRDEPTGWCTPLIVEHGGRKEVVVNGTNRVRSYDLASGEVLWECGGQTVNAIPSPVAADDLVYVTSGFRGSALQAIRLGGAGDLTDTDHLVWQHDRNTPYVPSPLLHDGLLYFLSGNNAQLSIFAAADGTPHVKAERLEGVLGVYASPVAAAGRVYLAGRNGVTAVLKHGPALEVLATNRLDDGFDASPVAVGNDLLLRGRENLYCLSRGE